jgi:cobalt/nickel transport system ATP-binding protein
MSEPPLFACERISFRRRKDGPLLLSEVSVSLGPHERLGILGPNGSGKSTLLHIGAGLLQPDCGLVLYEGRVCRTEKDFVQARKKLGYLLQQTEDQLFCSSILEDVAFGPYNLGHSAAAAEAKARASLKIFGLEHLAGRNGLHLSGGEQKLAALASILVMDVSLLFLDEPTNNLDERSRDLLLRILKLYNLPALIVSHDLPFLLTTCTSFCMLEDGLLTRIQPPEPK